MTTWLMAWTPDRVQGADDQARAFADFCQQTIGTPWPTVRDLTILRKKCKDFFSHYPETDWRTLCRVASWCRSKKKRVPRVWMVVELFREAWRGGALPELDPAQRAESDVEAGIAAALETEQRQDWRHILLVARGLEARREAYDSWLASTPLSSVS